MTDTPERSFVSATAAEIDRLVVESFSRASAFASKPSVVAELKAFPQLLDFVGIVLLRQALTIADLRRFIPFTPKSLTDALIKNNVDEGIIIADDDRLVLTDYGRAVADGVISVQDAAIDEAWSSADDAHASAERLLARLVDHGSAIGPPRTPSNFMPFAAVCDRPTASGRTLRLLTAVRYWRSDAHGSALTAAGLEPFEAHALNRLWDAYRELDRIGQGFAEPGRRGIASLESRGYADGDGITESGIALREAIERETDQLTAPIYDPLPEATRNELLTALRALPI